MFKILSVGSERGDGDYNEDIVGAHGPFAWIFDGATATGDPRVPGARSDPQWLARRLDSGMRKAARAGFRGPLSELARYLIEDVRRELRRLSVPTNLPTPYASGALLRLGDQEVEYYILGDVNIVILAGTETIQVTDRRALEMAIEAIRLAKGHSGFELKKKQQAFEASFVNRTGGYWVFGACTAAVAHGITSKVPINVPAYILLATDGFTRVIDLFGLFSSWEEVVNHVVARGMSGIDSVISDIRRAESAAPADTARIKKSDDSTAILMVPIF